jgi:hypothetical protein
MALNIRNHETEKLAADLAALTGETKTEAVTKALKEWAKRGQSTILDRAEYTRLSHIL